MENEMMETGVPLWCPPNVLYGELCGMRPVDCRVLLLPY